MIIAVADDFTGAAELAGLGLMYGMKVELTIKGAWHSEAELLIIATDTRSMELKEAIAVIRDLSLKIVKQKPEWVYKKIDSVLRGHILEETQAMIDSLKLKGAIIVPSNPALGRIIIDGIYYVHGKALHNAGFEKDPEFGIATSSVASLLNRNGNTSAVFIRKPEEFNDYGGILVGEASCSKHLDFWAEKVSSDWLPVGAAGFFQSLLLKDRKICVSGNPTTGLPENVRTLYLCASTFQGSRDQVAKANKTGPYVSYMPEDLFWRRKGFEERLKEWIEDVVSIIKKHNKVIVAVGEPVISDNDTSNWIKNNFAALVEEVFQRSRIEELVIEGGGIASAVISKMGITRLVPLHQYEQGVIRMKTEDIPGLSLTLKPGSYNWPKEVWKF